MQIPHLYRPRNYQLDFLKVMDGGKKRAVIVWNRRTGKDLTALNFTIKKMFERVGAYYYFFPTYNQGRKVLWDGMDKDGLPFLAHFPEEVILEKNNTEMKIKLRNGSLFQIVGTDQVDKVVGTNPIGCVFSEYSLQNPKAWDFIRPILAENGGWAVFVYTPRGMNHGHTILQQARNDTNNWFSQVLTVDETKVLTQEQLVQERNFMPQDLFEQEYYCKFIEGAGSFFKRISENVWEGNLVPKNGYTYQSGVDIAKYQDYTVITNICLNTFQVGKQDRFNQIDYNLVKARIEANYLRFNNCSILIDSTGVGEPIYDDLWAKDIKNIQPYPFTQRSREDLLTNLQILIEQDRIKIPNDPILIEELRSVKYELTERGHLRIGVPEGMHDDMVMSLALACWQLPKNQKALPKYGIQALLDRKLSQVNDEVTITQYD